MITLCRSGERHHVRRGQREAWFTFHPTQGRDPSMGDFETLLALVEGLIPRGTIVPSLPFQDTEVITYVFEGALVCRESAGGSRVTYAGEFQRGRAELGARDRDTNSSRSSWTRIFQVALLSSPGRLASGRETKRFSIAQRRGVLCAIASHDGRSGSLRIQSNARVESVILDSGRHLAYALAPQSRVWLHVVSGEVRVGEVVLVAGDGAGVVAESAVSLIAQSDSEILFVVLAEPQPGRACATSAR